jgi:thiamine biosynthesis lipoprotein
MNRYYLFIILLALFTSCNQLVKEKPVQLLGEAQGTYYSVIYFDNEQRDFQFEIDSLLKAFDQSVSLWVPGSVISQVNNNEEVILDEYFIDNFKMSIDVAKETRGAFDPTVGSLVRAWGFGFDANRKVDEKIIDSILMFTGYMNVAINNGKFFKADERTTIDFNAVAQGYSVDLIGNFLTSENINNYLVDIGGEVKARGTKPDKSLWKVGIEKPAQHKEDSRSLKAVIELQDKSIATSGNYRKFYEEDGIRYSHTIDPLTGYPVQHSLLSVSVLANSTAMADAYATAFMVMGLEKAKHFLNNHPQMEAFFIYSTDSGDYETYATDGFSEQLTRSFE